MKLSEIITGGKISQEGIEYLENHLKEMEELRVENAKLNEFFAKKFIPYSRYSGGMQYFTTMCEYLTKEEFIQDIEKESIVSLIKTIDELELKISTFNALPWYKRIFKTP